MLGPLFDLAGQTKNEKDIFLRIGKLKFMLKKCPIKDIEPHLTDLIHTTITDNGKWFTATISSWITIRIISSVFLWFLFLAGVSLSLSWSLSTIFMFVFSFVTSLLWVVVPAVFFMLFFGFAVVTVLVVVSSLLIESFLVVGFVSISAVVVLLLFVSLFWLIYQKWVFFLGIFAFSVRFRKKLSFSFLCFHIFRFRLEKSTSIFM